MFRYLSRATLLLERLFILFVLLLGDTKVCLVLGELLQGLIQLLLVFGELGLEFLSAKKKKKKKSKLGCLRN